MAAKQKTNPVKASAEKTISLARKSVSDQLDAVMKAEHQAAAELKGAAERTSKLMKAHPLASAGVLLGAGVLAGVVAQRNFGHQPTAGELMMDALRSSAKRVSKRVAATRQAMK